MPAKQKTDEVFLGVAELAARYGVSPKTVYDWRYTGYGPRGFRAGKYVRWRLSECERWEREQEAASANR